MILTNNKGGQVSAEGSAADALKRLGWEEVVTVKDTEKATSSAPASPKKPRPRTTTK